MLNTLTGILAGMQATGSKMLLQQGLQDPRFALPAEEREGVNVGELRKSMGNMAHRIQGVSYPPLLCAKAVPTSRVRKLFPHPVCPTFFCSS
jgi:hypothetical protein